MATVVPRIWSDVLNEVVDLLLHRAAIDQPPLDCLVMARQLGITVAFDRTQSGRARQKRVAGRPTILLRPDERAERLQWATAHELGELFAWQVFDRIGRPDPEPNQREQVANLLASRLLLPERWFRADAERLEGDLLALKPIYRTASHELIALRMLDLGRPAIVTVFDQGRLRRRSTNLAARPATLLPVERACRQDVCRTRLPARRQAGDVAVRGWPVDEPGWRREILVATGPSDDAGDAPFPPEPEPGSVC